MATPEPVLPRGVDEPLRLHFYHPLAIEAPQKQSLSVNNRSQPDPISACATPTLYSVETVIDHVDQQRCPCKKCTDLAHSPFVITRLTFPQNIHAVSYK